MDVLTLTHGELPPSINAVHEVKWLFAGGKRIASIGYTKEAQRWQQPTQEPQWRVSERVQDFSDQQQGASGTPVPGKKAHVFQNQAANNNPGIDAQQPQGPASDHDWLKNDPANWARAAADRS